MNQRTRQGTNCFQNLVFLSLNLHRNQQYEYFVKRVYSKIRSCSNDTDDSQIEPFGKSGLPEWGKKRRSGI